MSTTTATTRSHIAPTTLIDNARRLGHEAHTAAAAVELVTGQRALALCSWCCERAGAGEVYRLPRGGECVRCCYSGRDCVVFLPTSEPTCPGCDEAAETGRRVSSDSHNQSCPRSE